MPTINYKPYPTELPNVSAGDRYQRISADANAFGAGVGQALENLGTQFERAGDRLATVALERQRLFNEVEATNKVNYFMEQADKIRFGDPNNPADTGFYGKRGEQALREFPNARKGVEKLWQDTRGVLQNTEQQRLFDSSTRSLRSSIMNELGRHYDREFNQYQDSTYRAQVQLQSNRAGQALLSGDDREFESAMGAGLLAVTNLVKGKGGSDDEAKAARETFASNMVEDKIKVLGTTDPLKALRVLESNRDKIGVDKYAALANGLKVKALDQEADEVLQGKWQPTPRAGAKRLIRGGALANRIEQEAQRQGLDIGLALAVADIESSVGSNLGRRGNIFQLGTEEWAGVGGGMKGDVGIDVRNGIAFLKNKKSELADKLGREPTPGEIYLAHQQGTAGAVALLSNPSAPAGSLVPPEHISNNGGDPRAPASAFIRKWTGEVDRRLGALTTPSVEVWGDSLGVGLKTALKSGGQATGGLSPSEIFARIKAQPEDSWSGKTVVLSSGSNRNEMPVVEETISYLKDKGANVVAVGYGPNFPEKNAQLTEIAARLGVRVVPAEGVAPKEGVHPGPQGYARMARNIMQVRQDRVLPPRDESELPDEQVPGLKDTLDRIAKTVPEDRPDLFNAAVKKARVAANMAWTDQQRAYQIEQREKKQLNDTTENELFAAIYPEDGSPGTATAIAIANNPNLTSEGKTKMLAALKGSLEAAPNAALSRTTYAQLYQRMILPDGDPAKITTADPIDQALIAKQLTPADHKSLRKEFFDDLSPTGMRLKEYKADFMKGHEATITKSNPLMGDIDKDGMIQFSRFKFAVDQEIDRMRKENKDPALLFNPKSPEYLGTSKFTAPFMKPLSESTKDLARGMRANPSYNPVTPASPNSPVFTAPIPGTVPPRKPGETPDAYEKRISR